MQTPSSPHTAYTQCTYTTLSVRISDLKPIINRGAGMKKYFIRVTLYGALSQSQSCAARNCEQYLSLSITFFMWEFGMPCLCLNLFVFGSPIPPSYVQMTHDMLTYRTITSAPIHELQIAAFPLLYSITLQHAATCSGIYGEDKIMQSFQTNNHCPKSDDQRIFIWREGPPIYWK